MSRIYERRRSFAVVFFAVLAAVVGLTMASMSTAWADGSSKCDRAAFADDTGYLACLSGSGSSAGSGSGSEDLPATGNNPMRNIVIGSAFVVVGAAAVAGSVQTRRRSRASY